MLTQFINVLEPTNFVSEKIEFALFVGLSLWHVWSSDSSSVIDRIGVGFAEEEIPVSIRRLEQNFEPVQSLVTTVL